MNGVGARLGTKCRAIVATQPIIWGAEKPAPPPRRLVLRRRRRDAERTLPAAPVQVSCKLVGEPSWLNVLPPAAHQSSQVRPRFECDSDARDPAALNVAPVDHSCGSSGRGAQFEPRQHVGPSTQRLTNSI